MVSRTLKIYAVALVCLVLISHGSAGPISGLLDRRTRSTYTRQYLCMLSGKSPEECVPDKRLADVLMRLAEQEAGQEALGIQKKAAFYSDWKRR